MKVNKYKENIFKIKDDLHKEINRKNLYKNIYLYLKIKYIENIKKYGTETYIPDKAAAAAYKKYNTLVDVVGYETSIYKNIATLDPETIYIPPQKISQYFQERATNCIDERKYIKNKVDVYISTITYVHYASLLQALDGNTEETRNATAAITEAVKNKVDQACPSIVRELYRKSTVYDFTSIPNSLSKYHIRHQFHPHHQEKSENLTINHTELSSEIHLKTVHTFYNDYILGNLILINPHKYQCHPLTENGVTQPIVPTTP